VDASETRAPLRPSIADRRDDDWSERLRRVPRRRVAAAVVLAVLLVASAVVLLARVGQLESVADRLRHASPGLLLLALAFETLSFAGYVVLTRLAFRPAAPRISWIESVQITLAGVVATRLVTAGGAGGLALTVWVLRAAGLDRRAAAERLAGFLVVLYAVFFGALLVDGALLTAGALHGVPSGLALASAAVSGVLIAAGLALLLIPRDVERSAPAVARAGVALALRIVRRSPLPALAAALAWWAFDIAVLWTTFEMFGRPPSAAVLVLCYFLGHVAQLLPLPGGVGPVEGGLIAAFVACGVPVSLAILAVLSYQAISTWLPALPGAWAYLRLRHTVAGWREASGPVRKFGRVRVPPAPESPESSRGDGPRLSFGRG
jgi:uncharacterized membrane protein YbhN (UPF0104 family)